MDLTKGNTIVAGRVLQYRVRKHRRARSVHVRVCRTEGVVVTLPWRIRRDEVPELLTGWDDWLAEQADQYGVWNGPVVPTFASGSRIRVLGRERVLTVETLPAGRTRADARLEDDSLTLSLPAARVLDPRLDLQKTLRRLARRELAARVDCWAERIGHRPSRLVVGERKSRWGSCSRRGTLSFCYRLVMAPPETIDAVVAHEICHLVHLNHSRRFYALLDRVCPGHREAMAWLGEHQDELAV